ncbi:MAG: rhodanese-like domain-containing protein, partial [Promethearchaeota archaeon]
PPISDITVEELYERLNSEDKPAVLIDVRTPEEYNGVGGHIVEAKLIPLGDLMSNLNMVEDYKNDEIVLICHSGARSMMAARLLAQAGFKDLRNLSGGMLNWHKKGYPTNKRNLNNPS